MSRAAKAPSVAVVIPCFNQARFLERAIGSVLAQAVQPQEVIVVDDGSDDDVSAVVAGFPSVSVIVQQNRGLAAARNSGLRAAISDKVIFLDADDLLLTGAIEAGLACFGKNPGAAFVYGAHRQVRSDGTVEAFFPVRSHRDLIRCNWVGMVGTAMFDRDRLLSVGGFDESLGMCEDWDAYLRLARAFPFAAHDSLVADYVRHDANASNDLSELWKWIEVVRAREWERGLDGEDQLAWDEGEEAWRSMLGPKPAERSVLGRAARRLAELVRPNRG